MKRIALLMLISLYVVVLGTVPVLAGQVGELIDFKAHTPAVADHVNQNFGDVKKAVNDNDKRISENATAIQGKQNRVDGTCPEGQSIRVINPNGSVECEVDDVANDVTEAGLLDYSQSGTGYIDIDALGVRDVDSDTVLRNISFVSPADGYVLVTVTGRGCIHTSGGYIQLFLKKGDDYLNFIGSHSIVGAGTACAVGEYPQFSWQYIEPVDADTSYNFQVAGHKGSSASISGNVYITSVAAIFLPDL
jgi:hypothetical protein